jgi:hypothetical protein
MNSAEGAEWAPAIEERFEREYRPQEHDYDPRWDYVLRLDQLDDPLLAVARERLGELAARDDTPFERGHVIPARLDAAHTPGSQDGVGVYCSGTYCEVVILVDLDAHRRHSDHGEAEHQIIRTVEHEVVHAIQEHGSDPNEGWADEDEAELLRFE